MSLPKNTDFEQLVESLQPDITTAVRHACHQFLPDAQNALIEDFCEEITLRLIENTYQRLRAFIPQASHRTWLGKIAHNLVVNYAIRQKSAESLDTMPDSAFRDKPTQEIDLLHQEYQKILAYAVSQLTPRERELYALFFEQELDYKEIAEWTGITLAQIPKRKNKLAKKLQRLVNDLIEGGGGRMSPVR